MSHRVNSFYSNLTFNILMGFLLKKKNIKTTCNDARVLLMIIALNESAVTGHMTYD